MSIAPTYTPLDQRPLKDTICLFDVDGPLTPARRVRPPSLPPPSLSSSDQLQTGSLPRNPPDPRCPPSTMRNRLRRRLEPRQARRTARQARRRPRHHALRLLLLGERPNGVQAGPGAAVQQLHQVDRRGAVEGAGQLLSALHCRPGYPRQEGYLC